MQTLQQLRAGELHGATKIRLSCGLTAFPVELLELADTLEYLDLSGNLLSELPAEIALFKKLKIAFFSDNLFREVPSVLGTLPNLEMLGFKANRITHIPENSLAPNLRWLILTDNQIPEIPTTIGKCLKMQKLMLAGNKLQALPKEMADCQNLELLRISANELQELPGWLPELPRLAWLAFAGNPCSKTEPTREMLPEIAWQDLTLEKQLGQGASGEIYLAKAAHKTNLPKQVAVKIFKGNVTSDGYPADEMRACLAAGAHPNLVKVTGKISGHPEQKQGLLMELIPDGFRNLGNPPSLQTCTRDTFPEDTTFTCDQILEIVSGMASVALHLHNRGIMHGDLYAHNILIDENARPLFGDLGAATCYNHSAPEAGKLEKLEVRAFGYLLEDLLKRTDPSEQDEDCISALKCLQEACLQLQHADRPAFAEICAKLKVLTEPCVPA